VKSRKTLYENDRLILEEFIQERSIFLDATVKKIIETLITMLKEYPRAVKSFDMKILSDYLHKKAEEFYELAINNDITSELEISRDTVYIYRFSSISIMYKKNKTLLYPFMLIIAANCPDFIPLLCRELDKIIDTEGAINLLSFLGVFRSTSLKKAPKLEKRDIQWLKELSTYRTFDRNFYRRVNRFESRKRYKRLVNLGVITLNYSINYYSLGLTPVMHLASSKWGVPTALQKFIEYEHHPPKKGKEYLVSRLFLIPDEILKNVEPELNETGTTGIVDEYYIKYNWDRLKQTTRYTWKLELDTPATGFEKGNNSDRFDLINKLPSKKLNHSLITYIEAVHKLKSTNTDDLSIKSGLSRASIKKYRKKSMTEKYIIPYWSLSPFIGTDRFYRICFENKPLNKPVYYLLEDLPKIKVMKSLTFYRYMIFLPLYALNKLKLLIKEVKREYDVEILLEKELSFIDSIDYSVNLESLLNDTS